MFSGPPVLQSHVNPSLWLFDCHVPGKPPPVLLFQFLGQLGLPALAPPNGPLHQIDLAAHVGQTQDAGAGVDHDHERHHGQPAVPRHGHPVVGCDDSQVRLEISEALAGEHRGHRQDDGRQSDTDFPRLHGFSLRVRWSPCLDLFRSASGVVVLAECPRYPRHRPSVVAMHGESRGGFRADTLGAVVLRRNLDVHAPGAALDVVVLELRVRVLHPSILDGEPQRLRRLEPCGVRRFLPAPRSRGFRGAGDLAFEFGVESDALDPGPLFE